MKTAMQMLIDDLDAELKAKGIFPNWDMYLEEEKRHIVGAYVQGKMDEHDLPYGMAYLSKLNSSEQSAEEYYNQTYNNENKQDTVQ